MKVLHVLYSKIYTGAEKVAAQIIKAFESRVQRREIGKRTI